MSIKYCIWDVGQVIYPYTLEYLDKWALERTSDKENFENKGGVKKFNYDPYMAGQINFEEFCHNLCSEYKIDFTPKTQAEINKALHQGVGKFFDETLETMDMLSQKGIENCILSNALPILSETAPDRVKKEYRFASFELGLLKPDPRIYKEVCKKLNCRFDEVIFIDDKEKNVQSARNLGIHGIVFNRKSVKKNCTNIIKNNSHAKVNNTSKRSL